MSKSLLLVCTLFAVALAALIWTGVALGSTWSTFIPDLIVGVVGAGSIGALIAWVQWRQTSAAATPIESLPHMSC
jgi:uncharacterized membrane protein